MLRNRMIGRGGACRLMSASKLSRRAEAQDARESARQAFGHPHGWMHVLPEGEASVEQQRAVDMEIRAYLKGNTNGS